LLDGAKEVYGYDTILQNGCSGQYVLSKESKWHNADSFAFVAAGEQPIKVTQDIPLIYAYVSQRGETGPIV